MARARFSAPRDTGGDGTPSHLTGLAASASGNQNGWTAGAGVEWQFAPHWTAKVEYQHLQFDSVSRDFDSAGFQLPSGTSPRIAVQTRFVSV